MAGGILAPDRVAGQLDAHPRPFVAPLDVHRAAERARTLLECLRTVAPALEVPVVDERQLGAAVGQVDHRDGEGRRAPADGLRQALADQLIESDAGALDETVARGDVDLD